jgi:predicted dithiol-disulfide oxidoreductase (DUF899 family)
MPPIDGFHDMIDLEGWEKDFNFDYRVSFTPEELAKNKAFYNYIAQASPGEYPGVSVFFKDPGGPCVSYPLILCSWHRYVKSCISLP